MVLSKALDDLCPTFYGEAEEDKQLKIKERIAFFKKSEVELDAEWEVLETEAQEELDNFEKERNNIFSKIERTNNSERVKSKISGFEDKKKARVDYLYRKMEREISLLNEKIPSMDERRASQALARIESLKTSTEAKIKKTELRYNTIIKNTMNSDNSERVAERLEQSKKVWERKYNELRDKYLVKESIYNNKRMEFDQIRIACQGFIEEGKSIKHWCTLSEIPVKTCYKEAVKRTKMINRDYSKLEEILKDIISGNYEQRIASDNSRPITYKGN